MGGDDTEPHDSSSNSLVTTRPPRGRGSGPIDGEFRVVWAPWRRITTHWWALGPYLLYCAVLWGLAALAGWVL